MSDALPEGWATCKLREVVATQKGKKPSELRKEPSKGFVPYLDICAIETGEIRQYAHVPTARISDGTELFMVWDGARSGWTGKGQAGAVGSTIMAMKSLEVDTDYLKAFLDTQFESINTNTRGTGIPHVDPGYLWEIEFPIAPLAEQKRIVAKLEKVLEKVDASQARLDKIPTLLKRFRQSVLAAACSGKLTADWREENPKLESGEILLNRIKKARFEEAVSMKDRNQITDAFTRERLVVDEGNLGFDNIPDSWVACRIGAIGSVVNGSTPSRKQETYWNGEIPWVSSGEVRNNIISATRERITNAGYKGCSVRLLPQGTVLLAMIGEGKTRGQSAILQIDATINQNIAAVVIAHGLVGSEYLWRWFQLQYEATRERGGGSGPQALNCQRVRELPFVLPPLPEQQEIVQRVEELFALADQLEARYAKAKAQIDRLVPSILAKAFRGELVPQNPTDEPASVLLARLRSSPASNPQKTTKEKKKTSK